jgi:tetratricopeptide (TPR) repeat protein
LFADLLWSLAEVRWDFEELPSLIAAAKARDVFDQRADGGAALADKVCSIVQSVVNRHGDESDRSFATQVRTDMMRDRPRVSPYEMVMLSSDLVVRAAAFRKEVQRLPLSVQNDVLCVGRHTQISFHRTLRVPEDGRNYPLPAGFGRLPVLRVEDYAERVPQQWLEQGGFIIPLYQREALFLEFAGVKWRPTIAKVSVGRVNAISAKQHDLKIRPHRQDYVVIPDQRWLDGINSGNGSVSQFVAMPLGKGYTIEAQVTDEEKYGGFQLAVFDPRRGRFTELDPEQVKLAANALADRSRRAAQDEVLRILPDLGVRAVRALQKMHYRDAARDLGISEIETLEIVKTIRLLMGKHGLDGFIPEANLTDTRHLKTLFSQDLGGGGLRASPCAQFSPSDDEGDEMGIAAGGRIKQQVLADGYGSDSWDELVFRDVVIYIVNSEAYQRVTGRSTPPSPITADQYARHKIPWYSDYDEQARSVSPVAVLKRILSIAKIDKNRGVPTDKSPTRPIEPETIVRIRTQTLEERWNALIDRAQLSSQNGYHRIAAREASQALDLSDKHPLPFFIRAFSNQQLGLHADAEADASACLKLQPENPRARIIRAFSLLALGETLLAEEDAEMILASQPDDRDALYVRAEVNLQSKYYQSALNDAEKMLRINPGDRTALRIKEEALRKLS